MDITQYDIVRDIWQRLKDFKQEGLITDAQLNQAKTLLVARVTTLLTEVK